MKYQLITALVTPFDDNNKVDLIEYKKIIEDVIDSGSDGIVVGGSTGENCSLTDEEYIDLIKVSNLYKNKCMIILNVGNNSTFKTIEFINKIKDYNHDYLMIVVPYYNKPNDEGIYWHFKTIANYFKSEKFILYNVPSRTIVNLNYDTLMKLIDDCPNIVGLKQASEDYELIKKIKKKYPSFLIYSGDDNHILEVLKSNGDGVISVLSHLFGKDIKELMNDYSNNIENINLDDYLKQICSIIFNDTNPISIKYAMSKKGYKSMNLRLPLTKLKKEKRENIDIILD